MLAFLKLIRFSNSPTVVSDILAGSLLAGLTLSNVPQIIPVVLSSFLLYSWGMALNDLFDFQEDQKNNNSRPLVTGDLSLTTVRTICWLLWAAGLLMSGVAGIRWQGDTFGTLVFSSFTPIPFVVACLLSLAVFLYDGPLKKTSLAPLLMGSCRGLNLALGISLAAVVEPIGWSFSFFPPDAWAFVIAITLFVTGVTWFARQEHQAFDSPKDNSFQKPFVTAGLAFQILAVLVWGFGPFILAKIPSFRLNIQSQIIAISWVGLIGILSYKVLTKSFAAFLAPTKNSLKLAIIAGLGSIIYWDTIVCIYGNPDQLTLIIVCFSMIFPATVLRLFIPPT